MKTIIQLSLFLLFPCMLRAQIVALPADEEENVKDICLMASTKQFAIDATIVKEDLSKIYSSLGLSGEHIEVMKCNQLKNSAMAYWDRSENHYYILVNEEKLNDLTNSYFSHVFIVAHEFAHIKKNHFNATAIATNENKRKLELEADEYAASLIKKMGGTKEDCKIALYALKHPQDDTYSDHPTLEKRLAAVERGFEVLPAPVITQKFKNHLPDFGTVGLFEYAGELDWYDIQAYNKESNKIPCSIMYYNNKYWIYWDTVPNTSGFMVRWNYDEYPTADIQSYFNQGYHIKFIEKMNQKWFVVMIKDNVSFDQQIRTLNINNIANEISGYCNQGYLVQNIIQNNSSTYSVLFSKQYSVNAYSFAFRNTFNELRTWYQQQDANGYNYMYLLKDIGPVWFSFMARKPGATSWSVRSFNGSDVSSLNALLHQGYAIDNVTCNNSIYFTLSR
jgi:hypothetical protein